MGEPTDIDPTPPGDPDEARLAHVPLGKAQRRERARLAVGLVVGALLTAFALLNLDGVKVHWIVGTGQTPLIVVIAVAFACGMALDRLLVRVRRHR